MSDSDSVHSARVQSRATIWAALIGSTGIVAAAWIGLGIGRNQGEDKLVALQQELRQRDIEVRALREDFQAQKTTLEQVRKQLQAEETGTGDRLAESVFHTSLKEWSDVGNTGVKIHIIDAQRVGELLRFQFELRNETPNDVPLALFGAGGFFGSYSPSVLYVEKQEYHACNVTLGSKREEWLAFTKIPPGVLLTGSIAFRGVPETVHTIELLQVNYSDGNLQADGSVRFRNIAIL